MTRHDFLRALHTVARPRNYLEIGVSTGASLALSRVPSIGIDPAFNIIRPLHCDLQLVRATSDDFFATPDPIEHLRRGRSRVAGEVPETTLDLAFIDGMHLVEFALRDFQNVERFSSWSTVIVFDDMLPRTVDEAARGRRTTMWAGDVYKMIAILAEHRPDLLVLPVSTAPTGVLVVLGADPSNSVLRDRYDATVAASVVRDPQQVPASILDRRDAVDPERLLGAPFWPKLISARNRRAARSPGYESLRREIMALASAWPRVPRPQPPAAEAHRARRAARRLIPSRIRAAAGLAFRLGRGGVRRLRR
jgi:methyltransferase family protein